MYPLFKTKVCNLLHVSVLPCYDFNASVLVFQERSECDMAKWRPLDDYSPIARLLVEYMWEQRPPLLPNQFAQRMGVRKQQISLWLNSDAAPSASVLVR